MGIIHKFSVNGTRLVLDVNSGALHLVDDLVWDLLSDYSQHQKGEIIKRYASKYSYTTVKEALTEIEQLVDEGVLFSKDPLEGRWEPPKHNIVKALCLHLAHDCNLRCRYCFGSQGSFNGPAGLMPLSVGQKAIDFLLNSSGPRQHVEIDFFGGEPLLNFSVLQKLVEYGRRRASAVNKEIKFTVTTNALLLNKEVGDYLYKNNISVILSLDGRKHVHDRMRIFPNGSGSYAIVFSNILRLIKSHPEMDYYLRGTFTRYNKDFSSDVLFMFDQGFSRVSVEPVVASLKENYALRQEDLPCIYAEYEFLTAEILKRVQKGQKIEFYHFNVDLEGGPCLPKRLSGCGAGYEYLAVTPQGDLYPCHQFVGNLEYWMGNVEKGIVKNDLRELFRHAHIYNKEDCVNCWAKFYCSGGCHASAYNFNGTIYKPHQLSCQLMKKRLECALYLQAMERFKKAT